MHGVRHRGAMAPQRKYGGGAVMHLPPPPNFRENSVMYTINIQCFLWKNSGMHA